MGYALIWIESLALSLLLIAVVFACVARWQSRWARAFVWMYAALLPLVMYFVLMVCFTRLTERLPTASKWVWWTLVLALSYLVGVICLRLYALAVIDGEPKRPRAASWPRGRLAIAFLVVLALHAMTWWNLDLAARQRISSLRTEAGALALSAAPARVPDRDNAAIVYEQAFGLMGSSQEWPKGYKANWVSWTDFEQNDLDPDEPKLKHFLNEQAPVLRLARQAAAKPGCYFQRDYVNPLDVMLPEYSHLRNMAKLLCIDARCHAKRGEMGLALQDVNAIFGMSRHVTADSMLVTLLVGMRIDHLAVDTLEEVLQQSSPSESDLAELSIDGSVSYRRALERALCMEQAAGAAMIYDLAMGQTTLSYALGMVETIGHASRENWWRDTVGMSLYRVFFLADDVSAQRRYMQAFRNLTTVQPYSKSIGAWQAVEGEFHSDPGGPLTGLLLPAMTTIAESTAQGDARRRVATLAVACHRYRVRHDRFPHKLEELTPDLVTFVPRDPFDSQPMKFQQTGDTLTIYSVGPDMNDDGGGPYNAQTKEGDISFRLTQSQPDSPSNEGN